jgi:pimeloyl-ACP methyl ester carboxylesterase
MLAKNFRVIRLDLPGFGESQRPNEVWGVLNYVKLVRNLLNKLNIEQPFALIGHSFGGRIAIKAAASSILMPKKLICVDSAGINASNTVRNLSFKMVAKTGKWALKLPFLAPLRKPLRRKLYAAAGTTNYLDAGPMREIFLKTIKEDLREEAKKIRIPTLFVWGEDDTITPLWEAREMSNRIQASVVRVVKEAGHFSYQDQPEQVAKITNEFLL